MRQQGCRRKGTAFGRLFTDSAITGASNNNGNLAKIKTLPDSSFAPRDSYARLWKRASAWKAGAASVGSFIKSWAYDHL